MRTRTSLRRKVLAIRLGWFLAFMLLPVAWSLVHLALWFWVTVVAAGSYALALRMVVQNHWVDDRDYEGYPRSEAERVMLACLAAVPLTLVAVFVWVAHLEPKDKIRERKLAASVAEAEALRKRESALGISGE